MRMLGGDFNVYYFCDELAGPPNQVRGACYGNNYSTGGLVPEVGDLIHDYYGPPGRTTARVVSVTQIGDVRVAFDVRLVLVDSSTVGDPQPAPADALPDRGARGLV